MDGQVDMLRGVVTTSPRAHEDVLLAAAFGDDEALTKLVRLYHDRVYRFGLRVCRDGADADDAVQEAFVKLSKRPDVAAAQGVLPWLLRVVRNACLRMLRPFLRQRRIHGAGHPTEVPPDVGDSVRIRRVRA